MIDAGAGPADAGDGQRLQVVGMTCQGCVRSVSAAMERVAPGAVASVDLSSGDVRLRAPITAEIRATLAQAIEAAGFEVAHG